LSGEFRIEKAGEAKGYLGEGKRRVEDMGYDRRDPEVVLIEGEILGLRGEREGGLVKVAEAEELIGEMGCHRWDSEVRRMTALIGR